jgi:glycosyltransferase involved in cell wall biosynthesis
MISIVIRTKNEERWIGQCLRALSRQNGPAPDIILVDNMSTDKTLEIAKPYNCRIVEIGDGEFTFGRSLNRGIAAAQGSLVALLSGHCVPLTDQWLQSLSSAFSDPKVAATYGRQEPLPDSSPYDKRDLWTTFGIERRVQAKDFFFHNANSMIRKSLWDQTPFDEAISGVEDRDWAKKQIAMGYKIVYEPHASVHHHHGIHHNGDILRAERVARVIELIQTKVGNT